MSFSAEIHHRHYRTTWLQANVGCFYFGPTCETDLNAHYHYGLAVHLLLLEIVNFDLFAWTHFVLEYTTCFDFTVNLSVSLLIRKWVLLLFSNCTYFITLKCPNFIVNYIHLLEKYIVGRLGLYYNYYFSVVYLIKEF